MHCRYTPQSATVTGQPATVRTQMVWECRFNGGPIMNTGSLLLGLTLAAGVLFPPSNSLLAQDQPVTRTELQRHELSGVSGREGVMYKAVIIPGGAAGKHTHPGDEFIYILKGTVIVEAEGAAPLTLKAGDSARLPMGLPHSARNGSTAEPAEVLVFLVSEIGKPLATAVE
jgi:quercetin dioxygenase-like cupin family protein